MLTGLHVRHKETVGITAANLKTSDGTVMWSWFWKIFFGEKKQASVKTAPMLSSAPSVRPEDEQQAPPSAPSEHSTVRPWLSGHNALSAVPAEVRTHMLGELYREVDEVDHAGNREFIVRLVRIIGTEKLDLPPFPDVARQLDRLLRQAEVPINKVVKLAEREPALVKRIWQMACSSVFAESPTSFQHAVARVGFDALWQIAMSICVYDAVFRVLGYEDEVDRIRQHGVVAAEVSAWLSPNKEGPTYLAGLLHDVGKLMIYRAAVTRPDKPKPSPEYVDQIVDMHHASLGVLVAQSWKLGDWISAGIAFHHDPTQAPEDQQDIAWTVHVANIATHTAEEARKGQECGGMMALLEIDSFSFDVARTIEKAHSMFEQLSQPGTARS